MPSVPESARRVTAGAQHPCWNPQSGGRGGRAAEGRSDRRRLEELGFFWPGTEELRMQGQRL